MIGRRALLAAPALAREASAQEAPVRILSGGALEPPLHAALELWTGAAPEVTFATAPRIRQRLLAGESHDLLLAPDGLIEGLAATEQPRTVARMSVPLGSVAVGVALRDDAVAPALGDVPSLRAAVLAADALVFNRASTGQAMDRIFARLGLTGALAAKSVRFADGDSVLRRIAEGRGSEIGFAATTEILLFRGRGVRLAGPLPAALRDDTRYTATALTPRGLPLMAFLASEPARAAMRGAGLE